MNIETVIRALALLREVEFLDSTPEPEVVGRLRAEAFCTRVAMEAELEAARIKIPVE